MSDHDLITSEQPRIISAAQAAAEEALASASTPIELEDTTTLGATQSQSTISESRVLHVQGGHIPDMHPTKDTPSTSLETLQDMQHLNIETAVVLTGHTELPEPPQGIEEESLDSDESLAASGSAVHILNKMIEVVEDEESTSHDDTHLVPSTEAPAPAADTDAVAQAADAAASTAIAGEAVDAQAAQAEGSTEAQPELTITEPLPVMETEVGDASDETAYPELSAEDQERYNKMLLKEGDACPACGQGTLVLRQNVRVAFLGCSCFPQCKLRYYTARSNAVVTLKMLESKCPDCGSQLAVKKGRYGLFIGCSDYPQCTYTYKDEAVDEEIKCPSCKSGSLERRRARSGRIFYGCNSYPSCEFIVPGVPVASPCKECGFPIRYKKKVKAGTALICANPTCASRRRRKQEIISA